MRQCKCGSYAINPHSHGRAPETDLDLCDVCYWRKRADDYFLQAKELQKQVSEYEKSLGLIANTGMDAKQCATHAQGVLLKVKE